MKRAWTKSAALVGLMLGTAVMVSGCNTVGGAFNGAGQDLSALGSAIGGGFTGAYAGAVGGAQRGTYGYGCGYSCRSQYRYSSRRYYGCGGYVC